MRRGLGLLVVLAFVAAACGSRLPEDDRLAFLVAGGEGNGGVVDPFAPGENAVFSPTAGGGGGGDVAADGDGGAAGGGGSAPAAGGDGGGGAAGGGGGGGGAAADCSGGASDDHVTGKSITISTLSDRTGPIPGLFETAVRAVIAWAEMMNTQGGICGRLLEVRVIDSKTSSGANRAGALEACSSSFALVGSMAGFDDGGAEPIDGCGIPDIPATAVNEARLRAKNTYPAFPNSPDFYGLGHAEHAKATKPGIEKKAAMIWVAAGVGDFNARKQMRAQEKIGYKWILQRSVQPVEPNYTPLVLEMQRLGVEYVTMISDFGSIARFQKAMESQGYFPTVRDWSATVYDPVYLQQAGSSANDSVVSLNIVPLEESAGNPEYDLYKQWLKNTGGGEASWFGLYAWSAARLFQQTAEKIGADLTREAVLAELKATATWDGHGLHAPHKIGARVQSGCFLVMKVKAQKFTRLYPGKGFDCSGEPTRL